MIFELSVLEYDYCLCCINELMLYVIIKIMKKEHSYAIRYGFCSVKESVSETLLYEVRGMLNERRVLHG